MIFHEAPHKLCTTLEDLQTAFGPDRRISLCRELTKLHEDTMRTTIAGAIDHYRTTAPKGEYVLVVEGAQPREEVTLTLEEAVALVQKLRADGQRTKDAVKEVAENAGLSRNELYAAVIAAD